MSQTDALTLEIHLRIEDDAIDIALFNQSGMSHHATFPLHTLAHAHHVGTPPAQELAQNTGGSPQPPTKPC